MVDLDALEAAGIANARKRAGLIEYLADLGFTAEEMLEAERRGRLFGLAGDAVRRFGRPTYSLRTAAEALGLPLDELTTARAWRELAELIARIGSMIDVVHRHQLTRPNLFSNVVSNPSASVECGVGFADLSGFTGQILTPSNVRDALPSWPAVPQDPLTLKGFDARVAAYDLHVNR